MKKTMLIMAISALGLTACQDKKVEKVAEEKPVVTKNEVKKEVRQDDKDVDVDAPVLQVDSLTGQKIYTNKKFRYRVVLPPNYQMGDEPVVGDGCEFWNDEGTVQFNTFAGFYDEMKDQVPLRQALKWAEDWNVDENVSITRTLVRNDAHYVWGTIDGKKRYTKGMLWMTEDRDEILFVRMNYTDDRQLEELQRLNPWME